jgi:hypothetical protein
MPSVTVYIGFQLIQGLIQRDFIVPDTDPLQKVEGYVRGLIGKNWKSMELYIYIYAGGTVYAFLVTAALSVPQLRYS